MIFERIMATEISLHCIRSTKVGWINSLTLCLVCTDRMVHQATVIQTNLRSRYHGSPSECCSCMDGLLYSKNSPHVGDTCSRGDGFTLKDRCQQIHSASLPTQPSEMNIVLCDNGDANLM